MSYQLGGEEAVPFSAHGADYVIRKSGSVYLAEGRLGNQDLHDTSLVDLWDAMYGEVANPTMQFTRGDFTVDGVLRIQAEETKIYGLGPGATNFIAATNLNDHMFEWDNGDYYWDIQMHNFRVSGNSTNQSGAGPYRGIDMTITAACTLPGGETYDSILHADNLHLRDCKGNGFRWSTTAGANIIGKLSRIRLAGNGNAAAETYDLYLERMFDGYLIDSYTSSIEINSGFTTNYWGNTYVGGGGEAKACYWHGGTANYPCRGNIIQGVRFDNPNNAADGTPADSGCLSMEDYNSYNIFDGCMFTHLAAPSTTNAGPAMQVCDDSYYNSWLSCHWGHRSPDAVVDQFIYAIWEKDGADYNVYDGVITRRDLQGNPIFGTGYWNVNSNSDVDGLRVI